MSHNIQLYGLAFVLSLGLAASCGDAKSFPLPFADGDVIEIELIQLEHPLLGGVQMRESLAGNRTAEFTQELHRSVHLGVRKAWTPYLIKLKLKNGSVYELKTTKEMFSVRGKDDYYAFDGGMDFLKRFFPKFFT